MTLKDWLPSVLNGLIFAGYGYLMSVWLRIQRAKMDADKRIIALQIKHLDDRIDAANERTRETSARMDRLEARITEMLEGLIGTFDELKATVPPEPPPEDPAYRPSDLERLMKEDAPVDLGAAGR